MFSKQSNDQCLGLVLSILCSFSTSCDGNQLLQPSSGNVVGLQTWGPGVPFTLCPPFIFISVHPETWPYVTHPLCNVQCTKQHFSGAAVSQGDRVSSTVSP